MNMQFKKIIIRSGFFTLAAISFVACGNAGESEKDTSTDQPTVEQQVDAVEPTEVTGVSFKDESGKTVSLNSLKGNVVFINFWATWCPPCIHEMPSINDLKKSFQGNDKIVFMMVDVDNKIDQSTAFMRKNKYDLQVYTPVGDIPAEFLGSAIPTTVILNKKGEMIGRMEGGRDYADPQIINALNRLVNEE